MRALLLTLGALLAGCGGGSVAAPASAPAPADGAGWKLVWSDEFDGPAGSAPNPAHWHSNLGNREADGWGNHELQYYTPAPRNAFLDGQGRLVIRAEKVADAGPCWNGRPCGYTSARLVTEGRVRYTYGKVEARIRVPAGQGIWPAFWSLGEGLPWPHAGEIDIMEYVGQTPATIYGTLHGPGYSGAQSLNQPHPLGAPVADDFHVFTVIKRPHEIIWLMDGVEYHRLTPARLPAGGSWVFERPFFLILNLAIGGDWPGPPDERTVFPAQMTVDWVRIYEEQR
ncbi:MAG: glycoside hydrolase family 16 protein [Roseateles sp.]|uniref:glycoside hydrolase family 16 protein n=1 Tax=Roseateles sp. TaxID=1971397 RepID=UPI0039EA24E5